MHYKIFQSPLIERKQYDNGFGYFAKADIKLGTILLIENVFAGDSRTCLNYLLNTPEYADKLWPRNDKLDHNDPRYADKLGELCLKKSNCNAFGYNEKTMFLALDCNYVNHSCTPNSCFRASCQEEDGFQTPVISIYATKNISFGDQIFMSYGPNFGHVDLDCSEYKCGCTLTCDERERIHRDNIKIVQAIIEKDKIVEKIVNQFMDKDATAMINSFHCFLANKYVYVKSYQDVSFALSSDKDEAELANYKTMFLKSAQKWLDIKSFMILYGIISHYKIKRHESILIKNTSF